MRGIRWVALAAAAAAAMASLALVAGPAAGQSSKEKPTATEVGVTDKEIHIAVIADVDSPLAPNLFIGSKYAVQGFAKYINATGGIAGRKLVVDFYDSKINPNESRNATIQACQNDFAMVGTSSVFLTTVDDMRACKDKAGNATGIPDIPFVTTALVQQCSDESFPMAPPQVLCNTKDQHPQTFQASIGRAYYYQKKYGKDLHGVYVFGNDSKSARDSSFSSGLGQMRAVGVKSDEDFDRSGRATQADFTAVVQSIKAHNSNYAQCTGQYTCTVNLRKEATVQGVTSVKVWDCGVQCYDNNFLSAGGQDVEGEYVDTLFLPFRDPKEQKANKMVANFVKYTGADKVDGFGDYAWSAAVAFRDAVNAVVKKNGVNGLTRANLFAALNSIHQFNADGMFGTIDLAGRVASPCHVLMQVQKGKFVRVFPKKPGTMDCAKKNVVHVQLNLL
ncbi:MAG TPA: ABC transporter substrate-binding protein [Acidimicrobiia bacterium]|nr:ABC transporter substrate-binding protein [Acidimicrobiia bacterium]